MNADRFQLAIIGGCAASQSGMPISRLYHRIVSARWKAEYGIRMNVILDRYDQSLDYASRVKKCLRQETPDAALIHVRPSPFLFRCKPIVRYAGDFGRKKWNLHPKLLPFFKQEWNSTWEETTIIGTLHPDEDPYPPFQKSRLRSLHAFLGMMTGLAAWARREEIRAVREAESVCSAYGVPLFIMGATPYPRSGIENKMCKDLSDALRRELAGSDTMFIDPIRRNRAAPHDFFMPDLWHLSAAGHAEMAEAIFMALEKFRTKKKDLHLAGPSR